MNKHYKKLDLNESYFLVQKYIEAKWTNKVKKDNIEDATQKIEKIVEEDTKNFKHFRYRLIKVEEIVLYKSIEKKPDNVTDIF